MKNLPAREKTARIAMTRIRVLSDECLNRMICPSSDAAWDRRRTAEGLLEVHRISARLESPA